MMRLLFLSFYYPPDLSAGSFRAGALVAALGKLLGEGGCIDVVTTLPNRYHTFNCEAPADEQWPGLSIRRVALPAHRSDMAAQSRAFWHFGREVRRYVADRDYDIVFATSSRLMTAALGSWIARRKRAPLYLDIRDIFVDTIVGLLPGAVAAVLKRPLDVLERWTLRRADRINLVSRGFEGYFRERYPRASFSWFTNGVDDEFIAAAPGGVTVKPADQPATILYAGNVGEGQGLHHILPRLAVALSGRARFLVVGGGGRLAELRTALVAVGASNVELRPPVSRDKLIESYRSADVLFLHLGDHAAFEKVLPSKVFEYAALGKPVLAGVAGYAARFVREEISNAAVFPPCDVQQALRAFDSLRLEERPRPDFVAKYARAHIASTMARDILTLQRRE